METLNKYKEDKTHDEELIGSYREKIKSFDDILKENTQKIEFLENNREEVQLGFVSRLNEQRDSYEDMLRKKDKRIEELERLFNQVYSN